MSVFVFCLLILSSSALLAPMTNSNGEYDIASVSNHVTLLEQMLSALTTKVSVQTTDLAAATRELSMMKSKYESLQSSWDSKHQTLQTTLENERQLRDEKDRNLTASIALLNTEVKYEAVLMQDITDQKDNEVLKFDTVRYNAGAGFHGTSGMFIAPASESYLFWCHVMNEDSTSLYVNLHHESSTIGSGYTSSYFFFASITTVTYVHKGDNIWFETHGASKINGNGYSNFGGALLHAY